MDIRTIEDLDKVLEDRKLEGFNHPHDEELFLHIIALQVHHKEDFFRLIPLYMETLDGYGASQAMIQLVDYIPVPDYLGIKELEYEVIDLGE